MPYLTPRRLAGLAACTVGVFGLTAGSFGRARSTGDRPACTRSLAALERSWGGTGEWQRLAPYPVARDASPTDSIGVWLERRHQPNGVVELRRVSDTLTIAATFAGEGCQLRLATHRRTFDSSAMTTAFTDARLRDLVRHDRSGMIYVWSPRMPLSVRGLGEARAAARELGMTFTAVVADASPSELRDTGVDAAYWLSMSSVELVYRNATIHYPSIVFYHSGSLLGSAVPGFKQRDTYAALAREAIASASNERRVAEPIVAPQSLPTFWVDHNARVTTARVVETVRSVGFFFKPIAGTDLVSYTSRNGSYLFDLGTRREQHIPGNVDPVPTPDGRLLMRPGLLFHPMAALIGGDTTPVFVDRDLPDEYQTASILKQAKDVVRYRVVTGWRMGARLRDYDITFDRDGKPARIQPIGQPWVPCPERGFSLPISSRGSKEIGVYDKASRTNRVIDVTDDGRCVDVLDLGFASGKLAFSYDGGTLAFATSRIDVDAEGSFLKPEENFYKDALLLYRKTGRIVSLSGNRALSGMTFPEFLADGRSIILDQGSRLRPTEVIRVIEVK